MTCQQRRDLLLLYVTDALDAAEMKEMREHLQTGCLNCAGYLAEARAVMGSIPLGLTPVMPPPHLKQKLMARIDAERAAEAQPMRLAPDYTQRGSSPLRWLGYLIPTAMAAGIAIVLTRSLMLGQMNDLKLQSQILKSQISESAMDRQQLQHQFQSQTQVVEMLRSPELKVVHLEPTKLQPDAVANLLWDQKRQQWAILTTGMTPAAPGETYELWFVTTTDKKVAAGTFDVDAKGTGSLLVDIPPGIGDLKLAAVTNEKAGGVAVPAGQFQVTGSVE